MNQQEEQLLYSEGPAMATIDISVKIDSVRNLSNQLVGPVFFVIRASSFFLLPVHQKGQTQKQTLGVPYQIVQQTATNSVIDINSYYTPVFILNPDETFLLKQICVFKIHIPLHQIQENRLQLTCQLVLSKNGENKLICSFPLQMSSLIGINVFTPFYFNRQRLSLEASCHTHLISIWNINQQKRHSVSSIKKIADTLIVSYNKLRQKLIETSQNNREYIESLDNSKVRNQQKTIQKIRPIRNIVKQDRTKQGTEQITGGQQMRLDQQHKSRYPIKEDIQFVTKSLPLKQVQIIQGILQQEISHIVLNEVNNESFQNVYQQLQIRVQSSKDKDSKEKDECQNNLYKAEFEFPPLDFTQKNQFKEMFQLFSKRIFKPCSSSQYQAILNCFLFQFIPQMKIKLLTMWNRYLQTLLVVPIQHFRQIFFEQFSQLTRKVCFSGQKYNKSNQIQILGVKVAEPSIRLMGSLKVQIQNIKFSKNYRHIIVLAHGFGATALAFMLFQSTIKYLYPKSLVLNSVSNELEDISPSQMGRRFASQVSQFIQKKKLQDFQISFIGHSLGGLVIRAALPYLEKYKHFFKHFISLGTPHLGYNYHNSHIIKLGMHFLNRAQESVVINTLLMKDAQKQRDSFLFRLSLNPGLDWFRTVIFMGSETDQFVSPESAMLATTQKIIICHQQGDQQATIWQQMKHNIEHTLKETPRNKLLVQFSEKDLGASLQDKFLGRASHIAFLSSGSFVNCFLLALSPFFS